MSAPMRLLWSPKSPFVRKVMIYAHELGIMDQLELVRAVADPHGAPNRQIMDHNPLGQIPTLIVEGEEPIMGSALICGWLEHIAPEPRPRSQISLDDDRWQALADGLIANLLQIRLLHLASPEANERLLISLKAKVRACLDYFEKASGKMQDARFGRGHVGLVCALGHLDFRFPDCKWADHYPQLAAWQATANSRPAVVANSISDDQNTPFISINLSLGKE